jgi:hypothetical protein
LVELKGSLNGIGLQSVMQLIGEVHHSGNLELRKNDKHGTLAFDDGRLVAAECGEHHGLQALASCVLDLADAEFSFVEGIPTLERTLDLGPADLNKLVTRINSGSEFANGTADSGPPARAESICPHLGFADDAARHYSRPTALHRCYAGGAPSLVSPQEQRELCLAGRFATCPRYRNATPSATNHEVRPTLAVVERQTPPTPPPPPRKTPPVPPVTPAPPASRPAPPAMPRGVAARLAASSQMRTSSAQPSTAAPSEPPPTPATPTTPPRRTFLLIAGSVVLGLLAAALLVLVLLPRLRPGQPTQAASPTAAVAFAPVAQPTRTQAAASESEAAPTDAPTVSPTAAVVARSPSPTPRSNPTTIAAGVGPLIDASFSGGPARNWLDNPPYATWRDGAYRFQARDATRFVAVGVPTNQDLGDVSVSAIFRKTGGPPGGGYGLIVRDQGPGPRDGVNQQMNAYVLEAGDLGDYGIWRRDGDHWVDLVPWTRSANVRSGGSPNNLAVRAAGDQLQFSVNGAQVAAVQDDVLAAGGVGVFVGGDHNEVALDHFTIQSPDAR